jgi:hypothetical protein
MTPEEKEDRLLILIAEWQRFDIITIELSDVFTEMIEELFGRKRYKSTVGNGERREEFKSNAYLMCCERAKKFTLKAKKNGKLTSAISYVSIIIMSSIADTHGRIANHKKMYQNES